MAIADRTARTDWVGSLARGAGRITPDSGAYEPLEVTWASRTEQPGGKTSPEELLAAAHSSCFAMALNLVLGEQHIPAEKTSVGATVTLDEVDGKPTITRSRITVRASVPGADEARFRAAVDQAAALCPVSRLFAGAQISVDATLEQS
ncbi:OsmC family peroxiredoxin [Nocardioides sp. DS6]|uniref:OsmC family peroxiredoxin n=1 Tax=Nocardioides eburneus TaxID=3231482 RepID=A0ABV3SXA1_9ACTN